MIQMKMELLGVSTAELLELENLAKGELSGLLTIGDCDRKGDHKGHRVKLELKTVVVEQDGGGGRYSRKVTFVSSSALLSVVEAVHCFPGVEIKAVSRKNSHPSFLPQNAILPKPGMKVLIWEKVFSYPSHDERFGSGLNHDEFEIEEVTEDFLLKLKEPEEGEHNKHHFWLVIQERRPNGIGMDEVTLILPEGDA